MHRGEWILKGLLHFHLEDSPIGIYMYREILWFYNILNMKPTKPRSAPFSHRKSLNLSFVYYLELVF